MPRFAFHKLVRDRIVDHQIASGANPSYRQLNDEEHKRELIKKVIEEATELLSSKSNQVAAEIADVQQALDDLKAKLEISDDSVAKAQLAKHNANGSFQKGLYVDYVDVAEDDAWAEYYRQNPERYPEIT